jgi:hypothetical protein
MHFHEQDREFGVRVHFVAACQICNSFKSNLMFETEEEVRIHVARRWVHSKIEEAE